MGKVSINYIIKDFDMSRIILVSVLLLITIAQADALDYRKKYPVEVQDALKVLDKYHEKKDLVFCENVNHNILKEIGIAEGYLKHKSYSYAKISAETVRDNAVDIAVLCAKKYPEFVKDAESIIERADKVLAVTKDK